MEAAQAVHSWLPLDTVPHVHMATSWKAQLTLNGVNVRLITNACQYLTQCRATPNTRAEECLCLSVSRFPRSNVAIYWRIDTWLEPIVGAMMCVRLHRINANSKWQSRKLNTFCSLLTIAVTTVLLCRLTCWYAWLPVWKSANCHCPLIVTYFTQFFIEYRVQKCSYLVLFIHIF